MRDVGSTRRLAGLQVRQGSAALRMGGKRWQWLHRAVYAVAPLAVLHFFWMRAGKNNFAEVAVYAAILAALLVYRALRAIKK